MKKQRMAWGTLLMILALNLVLSQSLAGLYLFLGTLLIPLLGILFTAVAIKDVHIKLELPQTCSKGQNVEGCVCINALNAVPVLRGEVKVTSYNQLTMEKEETLIVSGFTRETKMLSFSFESNHCGSVEIEAGSITVFDPFCLWSKTLKKSEISVITVLPDTFDLHLQLAHGNLPNQDSIEYAQGRTGDDLTEIFAIRGYQPGDSIRNIHWKLSGKYDDLMVKLASMPLENSMLLLLETDLHDDGEVQPEAFDALAEIYITLSQNLIDNEIRHKVCWYDHSSERMLLFEVNEETDLHGVMIKSLAVRRTVAGSNAVARYMEEFGHMEQAHIVYITHKDEGYMEELSDELIKTVIVCSQQGAVAFGTYDYDCTPENYQVKLQSLMI